mmetsp:Transcript_22836/g.64631  ORF Transcript_22836/g.64631 Transcript_22836/m.64631 type:complete len:205 (-) Transcript_22836:2305-2919(-)
MIWMIFCCFSSFCQKKIDYAMMMIVVDVNSFSSFSHLIFGYALMNLSCQILMMISYPIVDCVSMMLFYRIFDYALMTTSYLSFSFHLSLMLIFDCALMMIASYLSSSFCPFSFDYEMMKEFHHLMISMFGCAWMLLVLVLLTASSLTVMVLVVLIAMLLRPWIPVIDLQCCCAWCGCSRCSSNHYCSSLQLLTVVTVSVVWVCT